MRNYWMIFFSFGLIIVSSDLTLATLSGSPTTAYITHNGVTGRPPTEVTVVGHLSGGPHTVILTVSSPVNVNVPVFRVCENGKSVCPVNMDGAMSDTFYQDPSSGSLLSLNTHSTKKGVSVYIFEGTLNIDNIDYSIEHVGDVIELASGQQGVLYRLLEVVESAPMSTDYRIPDFPEDPPLRIRRRANVHEPHRKKRQSQDTYGVQMLAVIDDHIYNTWFSRSNALLLAEKSRDAKIKIRRYFSHVVNGMDLRYQKINDPEFEVYVRLAGFVIAESQNLSPWTRPSPGTTGQVDADTALSAFKRWLVDVDGIPAYDHAMLFTGRDLYTIKQGVPALAVTGLAYLGRICTPSSVSIVEDHGGFGSAKIATHELGHSLGSSHDGEASNRCHSSDQYIMAGQSHSTDERNKLNPWVFSPCSIDSFRTKLRSLRRTGPQCLNDLAVTYNPVEWNQHLERHPGQLFGMDEICEQHLGPGSYMCREFLNTSADICTNLWCHIPGRKQCQRYVPPRGTSCGNKRWCIDGQCSYSAIAPALKDGCVFGDQPGIVNNGQTCQQIGQHEPYYCYKETIQKRCCQVCSQHYRPYRGCEYGNKQTNCPAWWCTANAPNKAELISQCCATCGVGEVIPTSASSGTPLITNDMWGTEGQCDDHVADCVTQVNNNKALCYDSAYLGLCCLSCSRQRNTYMPACEYGDRNPPSCTDVNQGNIEQCSSEPRRSDCCATCLRLISSSSTITSSVLLLSLLLISNVITGQVIR